MWGPDRFPKHGKTEKLKEEETVGGGRGGKGSGMLRISFNHL